MWDAGARRLHKHVSNGQIPIIIHLGDHDPSGIDMTRDIGNRLEIFAEGPVEVKRIALNFDQIDKYKPPPNPAKITDSRFNTYAESYGTESWELDALKPNILVKMIQKEIRLLRDIDKWDVLLQKETDEKKYLTAIAENYDTVLSGLDEWGLV
jgi:hypothetical protein